MTEGHDSETKHGAHPHSVEVKEVCDVSDPHHLLTLPACCQGLIH